MSTLEELHSAQVRTRARAKAYVYAKLQHLIKSRTQAGYIHGTYDESPLPEGITACNCNLEFESDVIKVRIRCMSYPPRNNTRLVMWFATQR